MKEVRHKRTHSMTSLIQNYEKDKTIAKERRSEVAKDWGVSVGNWLQKARGDSSTGMKMFNVVIVCASYTVYTFVKTYWNIY